MEFSRTQGKYGTVTYGRSRGIEVCRPLCSLCKHLLSSTTSRTPPALHLELTSNSEIAHSKRNSKCRER
ncbi:hypothetical protein KC19_2G190700 [Ceratodon purpureus]|uniref:Uncharacterized protein n=1 Tax=Ceratodon purpureus TaxID=3225 RepID=A0A8T0IYF0_CERPU|nr:hypothetical protein KC19_2G190700 [Ceratodon purpureus]